ncbi:MAG: type III pantothenate kinase [Runella slithyformis]|jgi:type III pantothenate kinase|nr:MAG: type III pantothenate kinase [Runella slithyformis]TAE97096.1 MAG: type III pantothenate kinase [Runella slithyformis]TAF29371.1 MAG: type III pantothenate kinase [Runella slithyformis]TAF48389.1 MAG: type III pantothenate kinase [Runella slithyformis]TAF83267.1 MAG: type III pantothenate kinase [Runella slithyformis]
MLLAVDIGNTDTVFGFYSYQMEAWLTPFRVRSLVDEPAAHYESKLRLHFLEAGILASQITTVVLSCVVPPLLPTVRAMLTDFFGKPPVVVGPDVYPDLKIEIDHPHEIGSDLVANAVAAFVKYGRNAVVVDFGTALTFTTVSAEGKILGVAIAPGLKTAVKALFANTAQLPEVPLVLPESAIGKNTTHAIQAGILLGYEGLVRGMITRIRRELDGDCIALATGGLSSIIETLNGEFVEINKNLTLEGLKFIGEAARKD